MDRFSMPLLASAIAEKALNSDEAISRKYYSESLREASEKFYEELSKLTKGPSELDDALGIYLEEHAAFFCALGTKWGMRALLELMTEGGKMDADAS